MPKDMLLILDPATLSESDAAAAGSGMAEMAGAKPPTSTRAQSD
jgi:hypothetical protein